MGYHWHPRSISAYHIMVKSYVIIKHIITCTGFENAICLCELYIYFCKSRKGVHRLDKLCINLILIIVLTATDFFKSMLYIFYTHFS